MTLDYNHHPILKARFNDGQRLETAENKAGKAMKLYNGLSPNGVRVDIFLAEKGVSLPSVRLNIPKGETRRPDYLSVNPLGQVPALELDDGTVLTESIAICRYLESLHPAPSLFGENAMEQVRIEMWNRRMELRAFGPIGDVFRHEVSFFKDRGQVPEYAEYRRKEFAGALRWLDEDLSDGRPFIAGDAFTVADITGMAMLVLTAFTSYRLPQELAHLRRWARAMRKRESWPRLPGRQSA